MVEIWIHRKCAADSDEMIEPTTYTKDQCCQYCGEYGRVYRYVWDGVTKLVANGDGALIGESGPFESNLPQEEFDKIGDTTEIEEAIKELEDLTNGQEVVEDEVQSEDAEIPEEVVQAEPPTDEPPEAENETMTEIEKLKAQVAELEAKEE